MQIFQVLSSPVLSPTKLRVFTVWFLNHPYNVVTAYHIPSRTAIHFFQESCRRRTSQTLICKNLAGPNISCKSLGRGQTVQNKQKNIFSMHSGHFIADFRASFRYCPVRILQDNV